MGLILISERKSKMILMLKLFVLFSRSLQRALDRRLYLLIYGNTYGSPTGNPVWHFPEKVYESEETLRKVMAII